MGQGNIFPKIFYFTITKTSLSPISPLFLFVKLVSIYLMSLHWDFLTSVSVVLFVFGAHHYWLRLGWKLVRISWTKQQCWGIVTSYLRPQACLHWLSYKDKAIILDTNKSFVVLHTSHYYLISELWWSSQPYNSKYLVLSTQSQSGQLWRIRSRAKFSFPIVGTL